jgi:uncharacterized membrane protein
MRLKHPDLLLAIAIALVNVLWAMLPVHIPVIGVALALPLVFVLPGYTLTAVLFHRSSLSAVHHVLLSLGLSLAIDIAGGLLLNLFPIGLRPVSWSALLSFLTVVFAALVTCLRRGRATYEKPPQRVRFSWWEYFLFGLATLVVMLSILFSASSVAQQPHAGFTQFWMLPSNQPGKSCAVRLGIQSYELTSEIYRVDLTANGTRITTWQPVKLAPRQTWEQLASPGSSETGSVYIGAQLYRVDNPQVVYREVNITMYVTNGKVCRTFS